MYHIVLLTTNPALIEQFDRLQHRLAAFLNTFAITITTLTHPDDLMDHMPVFGVFSDAGFDEATTVRALQVYTPRIAIVGYRTAKGDRATTIQPPDPRPYSIVVLPCDDEELALRMLQWIRSVNPDLGATPGRAGGPPWPPRSGLPVGGRGRLASTDHDRGTDGAGRGPLVQSMDTIGTEEHHV